MLKKMGLNPSNSGHAAFVVVVDKIDRRQDIHYDIYTRMNRMN